MVRVPALPGLTTEGSTLEEAIANAPDAIALWMKSAEKHGEPVPMEPEQPGAECRCTGRGADKSK